MPTRWLAALTLAAAVMPIGAGCAQGCPTALLSGRLVEMSGALFVQAGDDTILAPVLWPQGHSLRHDGDDLVVVNVLGMAVTREGDLVDLGGGEHPDMPGVFRVCTIEVTRPAPD